MIGKNQDMDTDTFEAVEVMDTLQFVDVEGIEDIRVVDVYKVVNVADAFENV